MVVLNDVVEILDHHRWLFIIVTIRRVEAGLNS